MRHERPKPHVGDHVALDIEPGGDLDQFECLRSDAEHGTLGHEERDLSSLTTHARIANLFKLGNKFPVATLLANDGLAIVPPDVEIARGERAAEDHALRVLRDVDEAADTDNLVAEAAHVNVALGVDFRKRQEREIETAAVVEIELRWLLDHGSEVLSAARVAARDRRPADDALLIRQNRRVQQSLFRGNRREPGRDTGAKIANRAGEELHGGAAHDHFARPE